MEGSGCPVRPWTFNSDVHFLMEAAGSPLGSPFSLLHTTPLLPSPQQQAGWWEQAQGLGWGAGWEMLGKMVMLKTGCNKREHWSLGWGTQQPRQKVIRTAMNPNEYRVEAVSSQRNLEQISGCPERPTFNLELSKYEREATCGHGLTP